jgi:hypothetical protein
MQWQPGPSGGFSTVDPKRLSRPFPDGDFGPDSVNVRDQRHDPDSLMSWMRGRLERYRECPELSWGTSTVLEHEISSVLAQRSDWEAGTMVLCHNLADVNVTVPLTLTGVEPGARLVNLFDLDEVLKVAEGGAVEVALEGYGARWFRLLRDDEPTLL